MHLSYAKCFAPHSLSFPSIFARAQLFRAFPTRRNALEEYYRIPESTDKRSRVNAGGDSPFTDVSCLRLSSSNQLTLVRRLEKITVGIDIFNVRREGIFSKIFQDTGTNNSARNCRFLSILITIPNKGVVLLLLRDLSILRSVRREVGGQVVT